MTTHRVRRVKTAAGILEFLAQDHGREKTFRCYPRAVDPFIAIERAFAGCAFTPPLRSVAIANANEQDPAFGGTAKLVSKKWIKGRRISRSSIDEMFKGGCSVTLSDSGALCRCIAALSAGERRSVDLVLC